MGPFPSLLWERSYQESLPRRWWINFQKLSPYLVSSPISSFTHCIWSFLSQHISQICPLYSDSIFDSFQISRITTLLSSLTIHLTTSRRDNGNYDRRTMTIAMTVTMTIAMTMTMKITLTITMTIHLTIAMTGGHNRGDVGWIPAATRKVWSRDPRGATIYRLQVWKRKLIVAPEKNTEKTEKNIKKNESILQEICCNAGGVKCSNCSTFSFCASDKVVLQELCHTHRKAL